MSGCRWAFAAVGLACLVQLLPAQTLPVAGEPSLAPRQVECVAILGRVARPGTYRLTDGGLRELIETAGGFQPDATRNVRIIRHGSDRGREKLFVGPNTTATLRTGDIVIAEGSGSGRSSHLGRTASGAIVVGRTSASTRPVSERVTIAAVGLAPWPVVLPLTSEDASVQGLVRLLNHPPRGQVILVSKSGSPEQVTLEEGVTPLAADSVVVFPREMIEPAMLPRLPQPVPADEVAFKPPANVPTPVEATPVESPQRLDEPVGVSELPAQPEPADTPAPQLKSPREAVPLEIGEGPAPPEEIESSSEAVDEPPPFEVDQAAPVPTPIEAPVPEPKEPRASSETTGGFSRVPLPLVFIGATAVFLAILTALSGFSANRQSASEPAPPAAVTEPAINVAPAAASGSMLPSRLELLVDRQFPIEEEPVAYPVGLRLIGRPINPKRVDGSQPIPEPHFSAPPAPQKVIPSTLSGKAVRVDEKHEPKQGLLDRVLATVHKDQ